MPATRHHFACGHFGFGANCHRCATADLYAKYASGEVKWTKQYKQPDSEMKAYFKQEAARLRTLDGKISA